MHAAALAGNPAGRRTADNQIEWQQHLPVEWRDSVIAPLDFTTHREYEMAASRSFGYDGEGRACYYAHRYALDASRSDDDEDFYRVVAYGEAVLAWRLRDERWLIYRRIYTGGENALGRAFYSFSDRPPG
jgi:hypothetical protein